MQLSDQSSLYRLLPLPEEDTVAMLLSAHIGKHYRRQGSQAKLMKRQSCYLTATGALWSTYIALLGMLLLPFTQAALCTYSNPSAHDQKQWQMMCVADAVAHMLHSSAWHGSSRFTSTLTQQMVAQHSTAQHSPAQLNPAQHSSSAFYVWQQSKAQHSTA